MKAKHIITTCGIILGGLAATSGASAIVTYKDSVDVQFTFSSTLSMTLSNGNFVISNLTPGNSGKSNAVTATVSTSSPTGYLLTATVGDNSHLTTDLTSTNGQRFAMLTSGTALTKGTWGYTTNDGTTYGGLSNVTPTILAQTSQHGESSTNVKIGAYAADDQLPGSYENVVNFSAVSNIATHNITVSAGSNVSSVTPSGTASYMEGDEINLTAVCASGHEFSNWAKSNDYGVIANPNSATTTFTVGAANTTVTAYCD